MPRQRPGEKVWLETRPWDHGQRSEAFPLPLGRVQLLVHKPLATAFPTQVQLTGGLAAQTGVRMRGLWVPGRWLACHALCLIIAWLCGGGHHSIPTPSRPRCRRT